MALLEAFRHSVAVDIDRVPPGVAQGGVCRFIREGRQRLSASQMAVVTRECVHPLQKAIRDPEKEAAQQHIAVLADIMKRGDWLEDTQLEFARFKDLLWVTNGVHRSCAHVATEDEFKALFYKFDTNTRGRTEIQILGVVGFADSLGVSREVAAALYKAVTVIQQGFVFDKTRRDPVFSRVADRRLAAARAWAKEAVLFDKCIKEADTKLRKKLLNAGPTAVALVTLRYQPERAEPFWTGAAKDDGLRTGDPRKTLIKDMFTRHMNVGSAQQSCAAPALAWNAWFRGENRKIIKVSDRTEVLIDGTPFDGSRR
jgi:hypothetical protein